MVSGPLQEALTPLWVEGAQAHKENTIGKSGVPGLALSKKGQRGEPEAAGPPRNIGLGSSNEFTSWAYLGEVSSIKIKGSKLTRYRRRSKSRHSRVPWSR
ncbi:hypothetical protein CR513_34146, partial [Mucuna pruriens]